MGRAPVDKGCNERMGGDGKCRETEKEMGGNRLKSELAASQNY